MKRERWRLLSPHLDQALDLSGEERQRYLAALAGEAPTLAADLERLLGRLSLNGMGSAENEPQTA